MTLHERRLEERMKDPEFAAAYKIAWESTQEVEDIAAAAMRRREAYNLWYGLPADHVERDNTGRFLGVEPLE